MSSNNEMSGQDAAAERYAQALEGLRTAQTDGGFEKVGEVLKAYHGAEMPVAFVHDRIRLLRAAIAKSMELLN
jgi:hypothetical protein